MLFAFGPVCNQVGWLKVEWLSHPRVLSQTWYFVCQLEMLFGLDSLSPPMVWHPLVRLDVCRVVDWILTALYISSWDGLDEADGTESRR